MAIHKCTSKNGQVSYSDTPCPAGAAAARFGGDDADVGGTAASVEYYDIASPGVAAAHATWNVSYEYTTRVERGQCRIASVSTTLVGQIRMPRWTATQGSPAALRAKWDRYVSALKVHEDGHIAIGRRFEKAARRAIESLPAMSGCGQFSTLAKQRFDETLERYRAIEKDYDISTGGGRTQGAVF